MTRLTKEHRHRMIFDAALALAESEGLYDFTIKTVAEKAGCSEPLVIHYFGSALRLRKEVIEHAMKDRLNSILAQAIVKRDPFVDCIGKKRRETILMEMV